MRAVKALTMVAFLLGIGGIYWYTELRPQPHVVGLTITPATTGADGGVVQPPRSLKFEIDGTPYELPKHGKVPGTLPVNIGAGTHTITRDGKTIGTVEVGWLDGKSIINLDMLPFVEVDMVYAADESAYKSKMATLPQNTITVNGKSYTGPYRYVEPKLYLKKTWRYSMAEPSPDEIKIKGGKSRVQTELLHTWTFEREYGN